MGDYYLKMEKNIQTGEKRKRARNFTEEEKSTLLDIIKSFSHIVENKKTDNTTVLEKKKAWEEILLKYNCVASSGERTINQIIALYDELKRKARKNLAEDKVCR